MIAEKMELSETRVWRCFHLGTRLLLIFPLKGEKQRRIAEVLRAADANEGQFELVQLNGAARRMLR